MGVGIRPGSRRIDFSPPMDLHSPLVIACTEDKAPGWAPISRMVALASSLFEAPVVAVPPGSRLRKSTCALKALAGSRRVRADKPDLLFIANSPSQLKMVTDVPGWRSSFNRCVAWVVDSFWTDRIPTMGFPRFFQHLFIMYGGDCDEYRRRTGVETSFLGWGSDALGIGTDTARRDIDVLRVGRQPAAWEDDESNRGLLEAAGLAYHGRPPFHEDPDAQFKGLIEFYRRSRYVLAFSNRAAPAGYTHPTKEYLTGRWTDALAAGCVVAGISPSSDRAAREYLWDGATLELGTVERGPGLEVLRRAVGEWSPEVAERNRLMSLRRLDWRWRFEEIASRLGHGFPKLEADLATLRAAGSE